MILSASHCYYYLEGQNKDLIIQLPIELIKDNLR